MKSINSTTVLISWSPPFTLEGVPILGYNVTITNTTSGENETVSVEDTTLLYSIDHENGFTVTVVPLNEVGAGQFVTKGFSPHLGEWPAWQSMLGIQVLYIVSTVVSIKALLIQTLLIPCYRKGIIL